MSKYPDVEKKDPFSPRQADDAIFADGTAGLVDARVVAKPISIFAIAPDPRQPRRVMPSAVRHEPLPATLNGDGDQMTWRLNFWARRAFIESTGSPPNKIDLAWGFYEGIVEGKDVYRAEKPGVISGALLAVAELAASIKRDGLTNPITITPPLTPPRSIREGNEAHYVIETGERRWLAYHLLFHLYGGAWDKIPARVQDKLDVWKQASENNQRSDLNAIGKARQFAILLMDLLAAPDPHSGEAPPFKSYDECDSDQDYYAQVADGDVYRIPYGKADLLLNALGVKNRQSLYQYRALLSLSPEFWIQGDDENWSRDILLSIVNGVHNLEDKPHPQPLPVDREGSEGDDYSGADLSQVDISQMEESAPLPQPNPSPQPPPQSVREGEKTPAVASPPPPPVEYIPNSGGRIRMAKGVEVWTKNGRRGTIDQVLNANLVVVDFGTSRKPVQVVDLLTENPTPPLAPLPQGLPPVAQSVREGEKETPKLEVGDWVRAASGQVGQVVDTSVYPILVQTANGVRKYLPEHLVKIDEPTSPPNPLSMNGEGEKNGAAPASTAVGGLPWVVLKQAGYMIGDADGHTILNVYHNGGADVSIATWVADMANLMGSEEVQGALRVMRYAFDRTLEEETAAADLLADIENLRDILNEIEPEVKHLVDYPGSEAD